MCGIAGWISGAGPAVDRDVLGRMTAALAHRGPDAQGLVVDGPMGFGHRRLSVIDLSAAANQPMWDASGRYLLIYNGEIYNFRRLRKELEALGRVFSTAGDSEVLLAGLTQWGPSVLAQLIGMFAFALWDKERRTLLLARDRLGKKPLFLARLNGRGIAFASEPRALLAHPGVSREIDPLALADYLRLNYVPNNRTLFEGVESLPPACYAEFDFERGLRVQSYWDLASRFREKRRFASQGEASEELRGLIDDAVGMRLISDVPLGAFLSGGVDSSAIVASMLVHREPSSVLTFSSGFLEDTFDESALAQRFAAEVGTVHRTQKVDPKSVELLPAVIATATEPLADTSSLPVYLLSRFTRRHVTVALSGDGGDECFAGYETYVADKLHGFASRMPSGLRATLPGMLDRFLPVSHNKVDWTDKLRRFSGALALGPECAHTSWRDIMSEAQLASVMRPDWRGQLGPRDKTSLFDRYFARHFDEVKDCHPLDQATYVDIKTWLADDILVKADRMSMAHSLEVRCPLLDHRVVEFAAQLPPDFKLSGYSKKHCLRLSQRGRVPDAILDRAKRGFTAPVSRWILGPLRQLCEDTLYTPSVSAWFDTDQIRRLWREHEDQTRDNGMKLFGLLTVALFLDSAMRRGDA